MVDHFTLAREQLTMFRVCCRQTGKAARCAVQDEVDDLPPLGVECLYL
jgi:hypothetical protein